MGWGGFWCPLTQGTGALPRLEERSQASKGFQDWGRNQMEAKASQLMVGWGRGSLLSSHAMFTWGSLVNHLRRPSLRDRHGAENKMNLIGFHHLLPPASNPSDHRNEISTEVTTEQGGKVMMKAMSAFRFPTMFAKSFLSLPGLSLASLSPRR